MRLDSKTWKATDDLFAEEIAATAAQLPAPRGPIRGTTPNYATGEFPNTDRLLSHTFQSKEASYFHFCILIKWPSASAPLPSRLPGLRSTCGPVRRFVAAIAVLR